MAATQTRAFMSVLVVLAMIVTAGCAARIGPGLMLGNADQGAMLSGLMSGGPMSGDCDGGKGSDGAAETCAVTCVIASLPPANSNFVYCGTCREAPVGAEVTRMVGMSGRPDLHPPRSIGPS